MKPSLCLGRLRHFPLALLLAWSCLFAFSSSAKAWWNPEWTIRKKLTIDTSAAGANITEPIGSTVVLVRLHDGDFQFAAAKEDGSDIRILAADDKTLLTYHLEKYDGLLNEAFLWVKVPDLKPGAPTTLWMYYGNSGEKAAKVEDAKATYDADTVLVYHLSESGAAPADVTSGAHNAEAAGVPVPAALIGGGLRFNGQNGISTAATPELAWTEGSALTWSAWIKPSGAPANAEIFSRREESRSFVIGLDAGVPYVEAAGIGAAERSAGTAALPPDVWHHLAVTAAGGQITLWADGEKVATLAANLPALNSTLVFGKLAQSASSGYVGELDEVMIAKVARPVGWIKLAALQQATGDKAGKVLVSGNDEQGAHAEENEIAKHFSLIADISKSLTFDGWAVIGLCTLLALIGGVVSITKLLYLNRISQATNVFLKQWQEIATNLHVLDHGDEDSISSMGGKAAPKIQKQMADSPLYRLYQIGSGEIQDRLATARENFTGLSGRSMQAIRATLDGGLVREVQKLNSQLVFLTIGIAGGPYLGLLGTVIGVMITFAVIAKSGQVEVNSIAPGIAGALLATVAGLAVAIPALFAYSYISSRIKDAISEMQIFIDEFVAKIAEFYSSPH